MRKCRVIIISRDSDAASVLSGFFDARGYETAVLRYPAPCPVAGKNERCPGPPGCCDIMVIRHEAPDLDAIDLLAAQHRGGCGLDAANKAVIGPPLDDEERALLAAWGATYFTTPLDLPVLAKWVAEREARMDLEQPVAIKRMEDRLEARREQLCLLLLGEEVEQVALVNKSRCGACFRTSRRLERNQMLHIRSTATDAIDDAVVRWIRPAGGDSYLVGLSYCA